MSCGPFRVVRRTFSYVDIRIVEKENTKLSLAVLFQPNCGKHYFSCYLDSLFSCVFLVVVFVKIKTTRNQSKFQNYVV